MLTITGGITPIQTLRHLTPSEENNQAMKSRQEEFDAAIKSKLGDSMTVPPSTSTGESIYPKSDDIPKEQRADIVYEEYEGL